jgi:hypothetical protein
VTTLTASDLVTIEEAANVLASAAKHNANLGRTVMAHVQQDRADRLKSILTKFENKLDKA